MKSSPDPWLIALIIFFVAAITSGIYLYLKLRPKFKVATAGSPSEDSAFSNSLLVDKDLQPWLEEHYARTIPVLRVWQQRAWIYGWLHYYAVTWTTLIALSLPFLIPYIKPGNDSSVFVQSVSAFGAIVFGMHRAFKVHELFGKYRLHESSVYALVRKMKDSPESFGKSPEERRKRYALEVEAVRERARSDEVGSIPTTSAVAHHEA